MALFLRIEPDITVEPCLISQQIIITITQAKARRKHPASPARHQRTSIKQLQQLRLARAIPADDDIDTIR